MEVRPELEAARRDGSKYPACEISCGATFADAQAFQVPNFWAVLILKRGNLSFPHPRLSDHHNHWNFSITHPTKRADTKLHSISTSRLDRFTVLLAIILVKVCVAHRQSPSRHLPPTAVPLFSYRF